MEIRGDSKPHKPPMSLSHRTDYCTRDLSSEKTLSPSQSIYIEGIQATGGNGGELFHKPVYAPAFVRAILIIFVLYYKLSDLMKYFVN